MFKRLSVIVALNLVLASLSLAQNANTAPPTTRRRTSTNSNTNKSTPPAASDIEERSIEPSTPPTTQQPRARRAGVNRAASSSSDSATDPTSRGVLSAFNSLLDGIRAADVAAVSNAYWRSTQLTLFNYNGTVTKGWEQMRSNRASSYPEIKNVKLDVRDVRVQMLGRDGALVTCLWRQSQTFHDAPETSSGRMTLVFRRVGNAWKAVHLHTSPDAPDPSRVPPSEQTTEQTTRPAATP